MADRSAALTRGYWPVLLVLAAALGLAACKETRAEEAARPSNEKQPAGASAPKRANPAASGPTPAASAPLTIAYSDWPGWVAWDIATEKGYFRAAGLDVKLVWFEYVPSMEAFSAGKVDAVCMTNGDALVAASSGAQSVGILLNDYSNGNDMVIARPGIAKLAELKGKKVGVEVGFVDHLLLLQALKSVHLAESDVDIVSAKTHETPELLKSGSVAAVAAWQPNSGQALERVPGSRVIFSSADVPGLIYDLLFVNPKGLKQRRADWEKIVGVWFRVADYVANPATRGDAIAIMSRRVGLSPEKYASLIGGTFILDGKGNKQHFARGPTLESVYGSTETVDRFNVDNRIYKDPSVIDGFFDASLVNEVAP